MILRVNWNGTRKQWTIKMTGKEGNKPSTYADTLVLKQVQLEVHQGVRKLYLAKRSSATHAFLLGKLDKKPPVMLEQGVVEIVYAVRACPFFYIRTPGPDYGLPVWRAERVYLLASGKILAELP